MIKSIIIDDELKSCTSLFNKLKTHCPDVEVLEICNSGEEGLRAIRELTPQLVFLDIEMPVMNGFAMLDKVEKKDFEVIFITAYNEHAVKAIKCSALDYLVKPVDTDELKLALQRFHEKGESMQRSESQYDILLHNFKSGQVTKHKIALPTLEGMVFSQLNDIIRLESDSNYTTFYFGSGTKQIVSKTLKEFEHLLEGYNFYRVHNSHIINLDHIRIYKKGDGGIVVMSDGSEITISTRRKAEFVKRLDYLSYLRH